MHRTIVLAASILTVLAVSNARAEAPAKGWILYEPANIQWRAADSLPAGAQIAVLDGDPSTEGVFTMRIKMPDGYRVPPHWHAQQERVTVLSGTLHLGHGDAFDERAAKALPVGTYSSMPAEMTHFAWMSGETVLQLSSMGPWTITYVNPADDPRKK
jgi:hypothetical protein